MLSRRFLSVIFGFVFLSPAEVFAAQEPEYFIVNNDTNETISVALRARNGTKEETKWRSASIPKGGFAKFELIGFQPFDIWIWHQDLSAVAFERANLCTMMSKCRQGGPNEWIMRASPGRMVPRGEGKLTFQGHRGARKIEFDAWVEQWSISLDYGLVAGKQIDDPTPPEPKKRRTQL